MATLPKTPRNSYTVIGVSRTGGNPPAARLLASFTNFSAFAAFQAQLRALRDAKKANTVAGKIRILSIEVAEVEKHYPGRAMEPLMEGSVFQSAATFANFLKLSPVTIRATLSKARKKGEKKATLRGVTFTYEK